jgi:hypothetical protein
MPPFHPLALLALLPPGLALASCLSSTPASDAVRPPEIECRLEAVAPASVRFVLLNRAGAAIHVLRWYTPLEGWKGEAFRVTRAGREILYQGPLFKRGDPVREDYQEIPAGGEIAAVADLAQVFDLAEPGTYAVYFRGELADWSVEAADLPRPRDRHRPLPLPCPGVELQIRP